MNEILEQDLKSDETQILDGIDGAVDKVIEEKINLETEKEIKEKDETWMREEDQQKSSDVPVSTHIRMKQKLKGRLSDSNEEIERLKRENEALKATALPSQISYSKDLPIRPKENDYDTIAEFDAAMVTYDDKVYQIRFDAADKKNKQQKIQTDNQANLSNALDAHYERAAKLIQDNSIDTEVYKKADSIVREAIETIRPGQGDIIADQIISVIGNGSEKVVYYLGRNKNVLEEFKTLLANDISGLKASMFLGQQRERLLTSKRKISNANPPDIDINGDDSKASSNKAITLLKQRKEAIKKGDVQSAYDIKKQAKIAGIDVSSW